MLPKTTIHFLGKGSRRGLLFGDYGLNYRNISRTFVHIPFCDGNSYFTKHKKCENLQRKLPSYSHSPIVKLYSSGSTQNLRGVLEKFPAKPVNFERSERRKRVDETNAYMTDLSTKESISDEEWSRLKEMLLNTPQFNATDQNVETVTLKLMNRFHIFRFARLYYEYLKSLGTDINLATLSIYVKIMHSCKEQCTVKDFSDAEEICEKLIHATPVFSLTTGENIICGLSLTKKWNKALDILNNMKESLKPSIVCYSALIEACFLNKDCETGWKLIDELGTKYHHLPNSLVGYILKYSIDKHGAMTKLFKFYNKYSDMPNIESSKTIEYYARKLNKGKIKPCITGVDRRGVCLNCKRNLVSGSVTEEEFLKLRDSFLDPVLIGNDIFRKTRPAELDAFQRMLKKTAPYDFVLDGLNIAISAATVKTRKNTVFAQNLQAVVQYFVTNKKKVLVIGRKHMLSWPKPQINYIRQNSSFFLADDVTQDDTFLLYATLYSGINTNFVSRDLMRGHKSLLEDPVLKSIFWRWQYQHQYLVIFIKKDGDVIFQRPVPYRQDAHCLAEDERLWHIPCEEEVEKNTPGFEKISNKTWICVPLVV